MASMVQYGRRIGSSKRASSADEASRMFQPPDLRQVTVLTKAEWLRIQDQLNRVNKDTESMRETARRREELHLQSKEVVKLWSNTIAGQRQKKLEAKKIREEIEEEKRKVIDKEEAEYREQKRKAAIEKAKTQLYYQTDRVKGLHRALLMTEVLKEREAQIEMKHRMKSACKDVDKIYLDIAKTRDDEALRQEQQKALEKKAVTQAVAEDLKNKAKENKLMIEQLKMEDKKEGEETQRLLQLYQLEQRKEEERQAKQMRSLMQSFREHTTNQDLVRTTVAQKHEAEEKQRKLFLSAKQKMLKLRKDKEKELLREAQTRRERIMERLIVTQQEQGVSEEQRMAKAVAEQEARQAQRQRDEQEKRAATLKSIATHRDLTLKEKEQRDKMAKQATRETLQAKQEADRIFFEKQLLKAQRIKDDRKKLREFNATQMAEKSSRHQRLKREELEIEVKKAELVDKEENQFQQYAQQVITAAAEAQRNVFPLCKAAREGMGAGRGPVASGFRHSYIVQDDTGSQMPKYVSSGTQNIQKHNQARDIQAARRRLGFTW